MIDPHTDELEELAAGYALGALTPEDEARFVRHLAGCETCHRLARDYQSVVGVLAESVDDLPASPRVKQRLMEQIAAEGRHGSAVGSPPPAPSPIALDERRPQQRRPRWNRLLPLAASLLLLLGLAGWNVQLQRELESTRATQAAQEQILNALASGGRVWAMEATPESGGGAGVVVEDPKTGQLLMHADGLPPLPQDKAYEAWVQKNGTMVPAGLTSAGSPGEFILQLNAKLEEIQAVALSQEPAHGSLSPTGPVVLIRKL